ncbi:replication initiation and membrane attachment protein [Cytobacillus eiseniae]|uniref:Replication initiation and membrane attachment protein n=2 Tax=Cytobacillus eiseniae TaxID=762947 RepID=A0ABS4RLB4_9BACI|nr:replication initiation and membrane attachment protein [Cytobacillus eiseniae]
MKMNQHWQEILPVDRYAVAASGLLHEYDRKVLTFLYQPLIGSTCFSLYMTLWAELEENRLWSTSNSHHSLMNFMDLNLEAIYKARIKLEGLGLLKVFEKKDEDSRSFIYELFPPLTPEQFFLDGMLNIYLYKKVGKNQYARLKRFFSEAAIQMDEFQEVTKSFQDVYLSGSQESTNIDSDEEQMMLPSKEQRFIGRNNQESIQISHELFNFELLMAGLNESLVPKKALNNKVKHAISNLAFLYGIDPIQMKNIVISALNENNEINIDELRKSARDWYQFNNYDQLPTLVDRIQPAMQQTLKKEPVTQEEKLIHYLETTSPRQLLKDISGGAEPSKSDLQIIEDVMFQQKLLPGVVNVLIQYVMLKSDMKLTKAYVEKIASHWARKKISRVNEAMHLAKNEHKQYMEWADGKKTAKSSKATGRKKPIRTELLPDWFDEGEQKIPESKKKDGQELELKKRELNETLKRLRSGEGTK